MNDGNLKKRLKAVRSQLRTKGLDGLIVTRQANVCYLTGFTGDDSWAVVTGRRVYLITDSRYTEQAQGECAGCVIVERAGGMGEAVGEVVNRQGSVGTVGVEKSVSLAGFEALKKNVTARVKGVAGAVEDVRQIKDELEVRAIAKAGAVAGAALGKISRYMKSPVTEIELAGRLDFEIRRLGAVNSFDTIVAFGANGSRPHHIPGGRKLRKNDTILIDFGAKVGGYCSDITRCFVIGKATREYSRAYEVVLASQRTAIELVRAGVAIKDVDAAARKVIADAGLPVFGHGTGHGLGLEVHELPVVSGRNREKLRAGQVITVEPGVYIPGKFGIRIEDDVLVTAKGCRVLTTVAK